MKIYGDLISGNCLKVKYVADLLAIDYQWIPVDVVDGGARTPTMLALNPVGQVPFIELANSQILSQSNAIMRYLAADSVLIPKDSFDQAKMDQWLFWEQYSHETAIAVARYRVVFLGQAIADLDKELVEKGNAALDVMEQHLLESGWFVGDSITIADIGLYAYTQFAEQPGFSLSGRPNVSSWMAKVKTLLGEA